MDDYNPMPEIPDELIDQALGKRNSGKKEAEEQTTSNDRSAINTNVTGH